MTLASDMPRGGVRRWGPVVLLLPIVWSIVSSVLLLYSQQLQQHHHHVDAAPTDEVWDLTSQPLNNKITSNAPSAIKLNPLQTRNVLDDVVRLLLPDEAEANAYIRRYPGTAFRFYVYDLPKEYGCRAISNCIESYYNLNASHCNWGASICTQVQGDGTYAKRRLNINADVVIAKILSDYDGPLRTYNASKADLFVVPYPSASHCECKCQCPHSKDRCTANIAYEELDALVGNLSEFYEAGPHKHLFLASTDTVDVHDYWIRQRKVRLLATLGPSVRCTAPVSKRRRRRPLPCGHITIPYANTNPENQPNFLSELRGLDGRPYAMAAFMSYRINGDSTARQSFLNSFNTSSSQTATSGTTIAGRPVLIGSVRRRRTVVDERPMQQAYRDSVFCPCLPGDQPAQKRIFDAMLNGCIPVVLEYGKSNEPEVPSFYSPYGESIRTSYPFAQGTFFGDPNLGLDWRQLVVRINGTCGVPCLIPTLEDLLLNQYDQVRQIHSRVVQFATLFSYGMDKNGLQYPDAIAALLVQARHYSQVVDRTWSSF